MSEHTGTLARLTKPKSIAVVGASSKTRAIGGRVLANLIRFFPGEIYPVNPRSDTVQGLPAFPTIADVPAVPDLAILLVEAGATVRALEDCARAGVGACVVMAAGFGEGDGAGQDRKKAVERIVADHDIRVLGPNCMGYMDLGAGVAATFADFNGIELVPGRAAIVSQSGAMGMHLFTQGQAQGLGVSRFITTGNELDIDLAEALESTVLDDGIHVIGIFAEGIRDPERFVAAARRAAELGKPVVALKVGASSSGARASVSHTGSMVGADDVVSQAFEQAGIIRAESPDELLDFMKVASLGRIPRGGRVGIMTASGGMGIFLADAAEAHGLSVPEPGPSTLDRLRELVPAIGSAHNPVDVTAQVINEPERLAAIVEEMMATSDFDAVLAAVHPNQAPYVIPALHDAMTRHRDVPVVVCTSSATLERELNSDGLPATTSSLGAAKVLAQLRTMMLLRDDLAASPRLASPDAAAGTLARGRVLPEHAASRLLVSRDFPVVPLRAAHGTDEAASAARDLGFPVVVKISAAWMTHRAEHDAVRLGLEDDEAVCRAAEELLQIAARLRPQGGEEPTLTVSPMVRGRLELICGAHRDPVFGPVVSVGLGGTLVEIVREHRLLVVPFTSAQAVRAVRSLAGGRLASSPRGLDAAAEAALVELLIRTGDLMEAEPAITEIDLNPVVVTGGGLLALDCLVSTR